MSTNEMIVWVVFLVVFFGGFARYGAQEEALSANRIVKRRAFMAAFGNGHAYGAMARRHERLRIKPPPRVTYRDWVSDAKVGRKVATPPERA